MLTSDFSPLKMTRKTGERDLTQCKKSTYTTDNTSLSQHLGVACMGRPIFQRLWLVTPGNNSQASTVQDHVIVLKCIQLRMSFTLNSFQKSIMRYLLSPFYRQGNQRWEKKATKKLYLLLHNKLPQNLA